MYSHILSFWETFSTNCIKVYVAKNLEKIFLKVTYTFRNEICAMCILILIIIPTPTCFFLEFDPTCALINL